MLLARWAAELAVGEPESRSTTQLSQNLKKTRYLHYYLDAFVDVGFVDRDDKALGETGTRSGLPVFYSPTDELYQAIAITPLWESAVQLSLIARQQNVSLERAQMLAIDHSYNAWMAGPAMTIDS